MKELLKLMQERRSARMPFDTKRPIAKDDLITDSGSRALGAYCTQYAEF